MRSLYELFLVFDIIIILPKKHEICTRLFINRDYNVYQLSARDKIIQIITLVKNYSRLFMETMKLLFNDKLKEIIIFYLLFRNESL